MTNKSHHSQKDKRRTCTGCRQSKVKCDRNYPCGRCSRLGLECIEQMRCQGRPVKVNFTSEKRSYAQMAQEQTATHDHCYHYSGCCSPVSNNKARTDEAINKLSAFMTHTAADVMVARFSRLVTDGQLQHSKALSILRSWGLRSCRSGVDCSYGAMGHMAKTMGADLHLLQRPSLDPAVKNQDPVIEAVSMGSKALHPALRGLDDGMSPFFFVICKNGNVGVYSNDRFSDLFLSSEEACSELKEKKILTDYLWAKCFSPTCLTDLYEAVTNLNFGVSDQVGEVTLVLTVRDRAQNEYPGLVRVRSVCFRDGEYSSTVMSIIPLPTNAAAKPLLCMPTRTVHQDSSDGGSTDEELTSNDGSASDTSNEAPQPATTAKYTRRRRCVPRCCTINKRPCLPSQPMVPSPVYPQHPSCPAMEPATKRPCHGTGFNQGLARMGYEPPTSASGARESSSSLGKVLSVMPVANTPADGPPVVMMPRQTSVENLKALLSDADSGSSDNESSSLAEDLCWEDGFSEEEEDDILKLAESLGNGGDNADAVWACL